MVDAVGITTGAGRLKDSAQGDYPNGQSVAIGAAAAQTQVFSTLNTVVSLRATVNCWFSVGGAAAAHVAGSDYLPANVNWMLKIPQGATISFIQDSVAGWVSVTPAVNPNATGFIGTAVAAYSLRRLSTSYAGPCINVRRSSDNATQDIGFLGNDLNLAAFNNFVSAGQGFVTLWYDQSGNGNHQQSTIAANQPQLVTSVAALNGKPGLLFVNAGVVGMACPASPSIADMFANGGFNSNVVNYTGGATQADRIWDKSRIVMNFQTPGQSNLIFIQVATGIGGWNAPNLAVGAHVVDVAYSSASLANVATIAYDGAIQATTNTQPTGTITSDAGNALGIGNNSNVSGVRGWPGHIVEVIFWKSQPAPGPIRADQKAYWGTP